jgi:predicted ATP-grasp superfamily ATP-dependent carboligase
VPNLRDEDRTINAVTDALRRYGLEGWVLYPTREETVVALARHHGELSRSFRVPTPPWDSIRYAWDKRETYRLAGELGIAVPRTWFPHEEADLDQIDTRTPVIIKPAIKEHFFYQTGAKAWRADNKDDLHRLFRRAASIVETGEVIVQELIPGNGQQQYSYCAFFKDGTSIGHMTVRRHRQHPSDFGRSSTFVETVPAPVLEEPSLRFLREIGYYGLVELEYKLDPRNGQYKLLDVNARTWGSHAIGYAAGVDFPYLLFCDQMGQDVSEVRARNGVRWIRLATDIPNALVDMWSRQLRIGKYLRSLRGIDTEAVFSWSDPLPGLYEVALLPYLAIKRGL